MNPVVDIFIRTYSRDAEYHRYCMQSIAKFCKGFRQTVVVHRDDANQKIGYLAQQVTKLTAYKHTDADIVLITDSDTLVHEPVTPESFMREGKPIWMVTPWNDELRAHEGLMTWYRVMQEFFGEDPPYEMMRRHPFMIPVKVLEGLRDFCWQRHGRTIEEYPFDKGAFSEFNVIGMYAWLHHRDDFYWMNSEEECPPPKLTQFWSWDPVEKNLPAIKKILGQP